MKKHLLFLWSWVFLLVSVSQAVALDLKFGGDFVAGGMYLDRTSVKEGTATDGSSTAFYFQRLRLKTDFLVAPGLTLITRLDAMERSWGATRTTPSQALDTMSAGSRAENENIAFDWIYLTYNSPVGLWRIGYMRDGAWGTVFMDTSTPRGKIAWVYNTKQWMFTFQIAKMAERNFSRTAPAAAGSDLDGDKYCGAFKYKWQTGEAGILIGLGRDAGNRPASPGFRSLYNNFMPYTKFKAGPVSVQAELIYFIGKLRNYEDGIFAKDVKLSSVSGWVDATADLNRFYLGGTVAYVSGDDPATTRVEGDAMRNNGGRDWSPCLIMWNEDLSYWAGNIDGFNNARQSSPMVNAWFFQARGGIRPTDKLDIMASVSYAHTDKKPTVGWLHGDYGWETDLTATYKLTDHLVYMVGVGYLFTGDYYKGESPVNSISDNFLVLNKLTLTF